MRTTLLLALAGFLTACGEPPNYWAVDATGPLGAASSAVFIDTTLIVDGRHGRVASVEEYFAPSSPIASTTSIVEFDCQGRGQRTLESVTVSRVGTTSRSETHQARYEYQVPEGTILTFVCATEAERRASGAAPLGDLNPARAASVVFGSN